MNCQWCNETVEEQENWIPIGMQPLHRECYARMVFGSVAHQQKRCTCYGGSEEDLSHLTKREAAREAALNAWRTCLIERKEPLF